MGRKYKSPIQYVPQRFEYDCGIACVAMLSGASYEDVVKAAKKCKVRYKRKGGLYSDEVICVLEYFNILSEPDNVISNKLALVGIAWKDGAGFHFVVWDGKKILDPLFNIYSKTILFKYAIVEEVWVLL